MLVTNHVLSGALIGYAVPKPLASFCLGVVSHLALDSVPHWGDTRPLSRLLHVAVPDGLNGAATMLVVAGTAPTDQRLGVLAGMAGAALLDADKPSTLFFGVSPFPAAVDDVHKRVQRESPRRMPQELVVGATGMLVVAAVTRRARRGLA